MKLLRNRFVGKTISVFLLLVFVQSLFLPDYAFAFMGPHQPEYTSYESPGASDMVNLMTGDFSFSLPVLDVPGPEGSFSLPLSYNAGVSLDQEASWVGLGWSVNAGAITRSINEYPDDANGEYQLVTVKDLTGIKGWHAKNLLLGQMGWNSMNGHYGALSFLSILNASWTEDKSSVGIIGINVGKSGMEFNPDQFAAGVYTIASWGAGAAANAATQAVSTSLAKSVVNGMITTSITSGATSLARGDNSPNASTAGSWEYSKKRTKRNWGLKVLTGFMDNVTEYKMWLDKTRAEDMFGTLYLGNAPLTTLPTTGFPTSPVQAPSPAGGYQPIKMFSKTTSTGGSTVHNGGAASDVNFEPKDFSPYQDANNPTILAADNFSVKAPGISGGIAPYRLEVGSVSMPREMTPNHDRLAPVQYLPNDGTVTSYKVPFKYNGQISNSYFHHLGYATAPTTPAFYYGIDRTIIDNGTGPHNTPIPKTLRYEISDQVLKTQRIKTDLSTNKKIPQSKDIVWMSNEEIRNGIVYPSKFMDFLDGGSVVSSGSDRYSFRNPSSVPYTLVSTMSFSTTINNVSSGFISTNNIQAGTLLDFTLSFYANEDDRVNGIVSSIQQIDDVTVTGVGSTSISTATNGPLSSFSGIADIEIKVNPSPSVPLGVKQSAMGGFSITSEDGVTYHFALPTYDYDIYTEIKDVTDANKKSIIKRPGAFANTWLLTAITGSDFVDRNTNGMVDEGDWGYWVKLHYGTHSNYYGWRIPYSGYRRDAEGLSESFQRGRSQLVYLNSIETRSHIALFKKSTRLDGRSVKVDPAEAYVNPLKLSEIVLLSKTHYNKLTGTLGLQDHRNKLNYLFMDNTLSASAEDFVVKNALKRIQFNYGYDLCSGVPNNGNGYPNSGRLTLKSISLLGRNNLKMVPDYLFTYGTINPSYNANYWDGFGMYNGAASNHTTAVTDELASSWNLSKITTPMGAEIIVNYETDDYSTASGQQLISPNVRYYNNVLNGNTWSPQKIMVPPQGIAGDPISPGDKVRLIANVAYTCTYGQPSIPAYFNGLCTVSAVDNDAIYIAEDFLGLNNTGCIDFEFTSFSGSVQEEYRAKRGGGLRVGSIVTRNEFGKENKIRYLYTRSDGYSSGVIGMEPAFAGPALPFYEKVGYPDTPVMYGKVSVLTGKLTTDNDFYTKQVYEFETLAPAMYSATENVLSFQQFDTGEYLTRCENTITDRTSKVGSLKSVQIFDQNNTLISGSQLAYTDQILNNGGINHQGIYSQGVIMVDRASTTNVTTKYHKVNRTSVLEYPWVLEKVTNSKDGFQTETKNLSWDLITGSVNQTLEKSSLGVYVKTVMIPAYEKYPQMGSKAYDPNNKNMLSQTAGVYVFKSDAAAASLGVLSAHTQTWSSAWNNYRYYSSGNYIESPQEPVSLSNPVWRKAATWELKGDYSALQSDGTQSMSSWSEFNFTTPSSSWVKTGELTRFDHFSMPLESRDISEIKTTFKLGYNERVKIAQAVNAEYKEIAFSSAEDLYADKPFFGGEVGLGTGNTVKYLSKGQTSSTHTGDAVVSVPSGGYSFIYKPAGLSATRKYRASVWANSTNARIYYKINGTETLSAAPTASTLVNGWYRLDLPDFTVGAASTFEVGVKAVGGEVQFDDFRFQPSDAAMTCFVFPSQEFEFTATSLTYSDFNYVLDNQNLYTKYEYNERGVLIRTYSESVKYGVKLVTESKENFRRFNVGN